MIISYILNLPHNRYMYIDALYLHLDTENQTYLSQQTNNKKKDINLIQQVRNFMKLRTKRRSPYKEHSYLLNFIYLYASIFIAKMES